MCRRNRPGRRAVAGVTGPGTPGSEGDGPETRAQASPWGHRDRTLRVGVMGGQAGRSADRREGEHRGREASVPELEPTSHSLGRE